MTGRHPGLVWLISNFDNSDGHLPPHLEAVSRPFGELAHQLADTLPSHPELTECVRKILEAKDCAVRLAQGEYDGRVPTQ